MCAKFRFTEGSIRKVQANIKAWNDEQVAKYAFALKAWGDDLTAEIQDSFIESKAIDQGILAAAQFTSEVERNGKNLHVESRNPMSYAAVVELGRNPKKGKPPPLLAIVGWAYRKGFLTTLPANATFGGEYAKAWAASAAIMKRKKDGGGKSATKKKKPLDPLIRDMIIVRSISQAIYERGQEGRHPISKAFDKKAQTYLGDIVALVKLIK